MDVSVILFEGFTSLDFIGPIEALQRLDGYRVRYFSMAGGSVGNGKGLTVETEPMAAITPGILLVPGGFGTRKLVNDGAFISALRRQRRSRRTALRSAPDPRSSRKPAFSTASPPHRTSAPLTGQCR